jgi:hypothetical protein
MATQTVRLVVRRARNWKRDPGWAWSCPPCPQHERTVRGFTADSTFTSRQRARSSTPTPPAQSRAMDGARRHLHRYHRENP